MSQILTRRAKILLLMVLAASVLLVFDLLSPRRATHRPPSQAEQQSVKGDPASAATSERRLAPPPPPNQPWRRDPFAIEARRLPSGRTSNPFSSLKISGIVWGSSGYKALVNDKVVRAGDRVNGARIIRITPKGIEVEKDGDRRFLPLIPMEIRP